MDEKTHDPMFCGRTHSHSHGMNVKMRSSNISYLLSHANVVIGSYPNQGVFEVFNVDPHQ